MTGLEQSLVGFTFVSILNLFVLRDLTLLLLAFGTITLRIRTERETTGMAKTFLGSVKVELSLPRFSTTNKILLLLTMEVGFLTPSSVRILRKRQVSQFLSSTR
jgi:hypothetical protein